MQLTTEVFSTKLYDIDSGVSFVNMQMLTLLECSLASEPYCLGIKGSGKMKELPGSHCMYKVTNNNIAYVIRQ